MEYRDPARLMSLDLIQAYEKAFDPQSSIETRRSLSDHPKSMDLLSRPVLWAQKKVDPNERASTGLRIERDRQKMRVPNRTNLMNIGTHGRRKTTIRNPLRCIIWIKAQRNSKMPSENKSIMTSAESGNSFPSRHRCGCKASRYAHISEVTGLNRSSE